MSGEYWGVDVVSITVSSSFESWMTSSSSWHDRRARSMIYCLGMLYACCCLGCGALRWNGPTLISLEMGMNKILFFHREFAMAC